MSLNPDLEAYLDLVGAGRSAGNRRGMHDMTPEQAREQFDQSSQLMNLDEISVDQVRDFPISARDGHALPARLYVPDADSHARGALLYFHGGGYVVGSLDSHDGLCRRLSAESGVTVLSVSYRLAPEWRFPTAFQDAQDAWAWLQDHCAELGLDPGRLAVGGDSVGASLACALATDIASRGAQEPAPCLQLLLYPVTDASCTRASHDAFATGYLLEKDTLEWFYQLYQRTPEDRLDPRFSPLFGKVASHVAPAWLLLAQYDPLLDEGLALATHLQASKVEVQVQVVEGMTHDFMRMEAVVEEVALIQRSLARRLGQYLSAEQAFAD